MLPRSRIKSVKGRLNKGTSSASSGFSASFGGMSSNPFAAPAQNSQPSGGLFSQSTGSQGGVFQANSFPPPQAPTGTNSSVTASFPAPTSNSNNLFGGFNPTPPSGGFNFSAPVGNPFSASSTPTPAANGGFSGSIFNIPPSQPSQPAQTPQFSFQQSVGNSAADESMHISPQNTPFKTTTESQNGTSMAPAETPKPSAFADFLSNAKPSTPATEPPKSTLFGTPAGNQLGTSLFGNASNTATSGEAPKSLFSSTSATPSFSFSASTNAGTTSASQPSLFGTATSTTPGSIFSSNNTSSPFKGLSSTFSSSTQPADSTKSANAQTSSTSFATPAKPAADKPIFSFGTPAASTPKPDVSTTPTASPAQANAATPSFSFGTPAANTQKTDAAQQSSTPKPSFSFGTPAASTPKSDAAQSNANTPKPAFTFGAGAASSTPQADASTTPAKPVFNMFGSPAPAPTPSLFSAAPAAKPAEETTSEKPAAPVFNFSASTAKTATPASNLFGTPSKPSNAEESPSKEAASTSAKPAANPFASINNASPFKAPTPSAPASSAPAPESPTPAPAPTPSTLSIFKGAAEAKTPAAPATVDPPKDQHNPLGVRPPANLTPQEQSEYIIARNMEALNKIFQKRMAQAAARGKDLSAMCVEYTAAAARIKGKAQPNGDKAQTGGKRKAVEDAEEGNTPLENAAKKAKGSESVSYPSLPQTTDSPSKTASLFKNIAEKPAEKPVAAPAATNGPVTNGTAPAAASPFKPVTQPAAASPFKPVTSTQPSTNGTGAATPFKAPSFGASTSNSGNTASAVKPPTFEVPKFGAVNPTNFFGQFAKSSTENLAKMEQEEKAKRKAEEFDSDEDDEAEWERKYEEEQRAKKQKIEELSKKSAGLPKFAPSATAVKDSPFANVFKVAAEKVSVAKPDTATNGVESSREASPASSVFSSHSFGQNKGVRSDNPFGHLAASKTDEEPEDEGEPTDDDNDAEDEGTENDEDGSNQGTTAEASQQASEQGSDKEESSDASKGENGSTPAKKPEATSTSTPAAGRSLFDRISFGADGKPEKEASSAESTATPATKNVFAASQTPGGNLFGNIFNTPLTKKGDDGPGDFTFKQNTPIKFAQDNKAAPSFNFTPASPGASKPTSTLFGSASKPATGSSLFGNSTPGGASAGFTFGAKPSGNTASSLLSAGPSSTAASGYNSPMPGSSRATTPGASAAETSAAESTNADAANDGDAAPEEPQAEDLTALTPEERANENVTFEAKAKAMKHNKDAPGGWENRGIGPLRILTHKESGASRFLMRTAPSGRLVLNARVLPSPAPKRGNEKIVQVVIAEEGSKLSTWVMRFGKKETADEFLKSATEAGREKA